MNNSLTQLMVTSLVLLPALAGAETVTKRVDLEGIKHLHLLGTYDLTVTQGSEEFVEVTTDSALIDNIVAKIQGSKLVLGRDGNRFDWEAFDSGNNHDHAAFAVQVQDLRSVSNLGIGNVIIENIDTDEDLAFSNLGAGHFILRAVNADDVDVNNMGAGRVEVSNLRIESINENSSGAGVVEYDNINAEKWEINSFGNARTTVTGSSEVRELEITISGNSSVDAESLLARKADVVLKGAGLVRVNVSNELDVEITGSGKVYYRGTPEVKRDLGRAGELIAIDQ